MDLDTANTAIVLDSTADYPEGPDRFVNWRVVPLYVRFGEESFRDYVELGPHEFYERLRRAAELPTTSQPTPGDFLAAYEELAGYERILSLHLPLKMSGTVESARLAGEELGGGKVRAIDTGTVSAGLAMLALVVQRRLERGTTDEEVDSLIERYRRDQRMIWTVDTLEFLAKGGRIGKAAAMAGGPAACTSARDPRDPRRRGRSALNRVRGNLTLPGVRRAFEAEASIGSRCWSASAMRTHPTGWKRCASSSAERTRPQARRSRSETMLGAVVGGTHAGPGTVGLFWFDDA